MTGSGPRAAALAVALAGAAAFAQGGDTFGFMPPGGRTILAERLGGDDPALLARTAGREADADAWTAWARSRAPDIEDVAARTFAAYAELNFPVGTDVLERLADSGDPALLPPDGKDLAVAQCQFCHSMFTGYLTHDRDVEGWKSTFKAPFHLEIPMTETERATFATYSALNMPMKVGDVPPELRF
ncbi:hypothetical protein [Rhodosalinus sp. K401]|uniref:hypothetical protein n=1 Tax=Rhodosalinus sp. K401 TaxID=3239195 RepID=UPI003526A64A